MRAAKDEMAIMGTLGGAGVSPSDAECPCPSMKSSLPFMGKQAGPWVIRPTMSSPDVVPMSEDSQRNKENPRGFCLFCFVLVSVGL